MTDSQDTTTTGTDQDAAAELSQRALAAGLPADATEAEIIAAETWPKVENSVAADGSKIVTTTYKDGSSTYTKTYADGSVEDNKEINADGKAFIVRRYINGDIQYTAPSGMLVHIKCGNGDDVMKARRNLGKSFDEESFTIALMANLCKINGAAVPYEIYAKQFNVYEFMAHMQYFKERNF